jgi:hypothetical protein
LLALRPFFLNNVRKKLLPDLELYAFLQFLFGYYCMKTLLVFGLKLPIQNLFGRVQGEMATLVDEAEKTSLPIEPLVNTNFKGRRYVVAGLA